LRGSWTHLLPERIVAASLAKRRKNMKNVMYYYNYVQSEEELHEDEVVDKLVQGKVMERAGEYWRIIEVKIVTVASEPTRIDVVEVFLAGPVP
jgi:hypothetical protein